MSECVRQHQRRVTAEIMWELMITADVCLLACRMCRPLSPHADGRFCAPRIYSSDAQCFLCSTWKKCSGGVITISAATQTKDGTRILLDIIGFAMCNSFSEQLSHSLSLCSGRTTPESTRGAMMFIVRVFCRVSAKQTLSHSYQPQNIHSYFTVRK